MATFKICIDPKRKRKDGFYRVLIRVTQHSKPAYITTDKYVNETGLDSRNEVRDPYVVEYCMRKITHWMDLLNMKDTEHCPAQFGVLFDGLLHVAEAGEFVGLFQIVFVLPLKAFYSIDEI